ncbi:hypothetical protein GCM10023116_29730 [Kistimonas scapharcae]|uniref:Relaxase/mobilization nuclease domain-containing protein n=1 Tax=Kistimonas scapharcae TaxID=1036133 RepID=A0ABP8V6K6_9GAMM
MNPIICKKRNDGESSFKELIEYIEEAEKTNNKETVKYKNLIADNTDDAINIMRTTASFNSRVKNPIAHHILSWPEHEKPDPETVFEAADMYLDKMGYGNHQAVYAMHYNTDNIHVHIAINKVYYNHINEKASSHNPSWPISTASKAAREIEIALGFSHDNGNYIVVQDDDGNKSIIRNPDVYDKSRDNNIDRKAESYEVQTGCQSFQSYVKDDAGKYMTEYLKQNNDATWHEFHEQLSKFNLKIQPQNSGLVISDINNANDFATKASSMGRYFSKSKLEKRFGEYQYFDVPYEYIKPDRKYNPERIAQIHNTESSDNLEKLKEDINTKSKNNIKYTQREINRAKRYEERNKLHTAYKQEKNMHYKAVKQEKNKAWNNQRTIEKQRYKQFKDRRRIEFNNKKKQAGRLPKDKYQLLRSEHAFETAKLKQELNELRNRERNELKRKYADTRFKSWPEWVAEHAKNKGSEHHKAAVSAERGIRYREGREQKNTLQTTGGWQPVNIKEYTKDNDVFKDITYEYSDKIGLEFKRKEKTIFTDHGSNIRFPPSSEDKDIEAALLLAQEKFGTIKLQGFDGFKLKACFFAVKHNIKITNEEMQDYIQELRDNQKKQEKLKLEHKPQQQPEQQQKSDFEEMYKNARTQVERRKHNEKNERDDELWP